MGWKTKAPKGFDHLHRILGAAIREAGAEPTQSWHFGGPLPVLSTRSQLRVALDICAAVRTGAGTDAKEYAKLEKIAQQVAAGKELPRKELDATSKSVKSDSPALRVARLTARSAYNELYAATSARNVVGLCAENAAIAAVTHYRPLGADALHAFLVLIDDSILRAELAAAQADREIEPSSPLARIVSRIPVPKKRTPELVMAQLEDGNYGLWVKLKQKWEWHEGDRATVFATVPDAFMEQVIVDLDPTSKKTTKTSRASKASQSKASQSTRGSKASRSTRGSKASRSTRGSKASRSTRGSKSKTR